jgi:hypothetical protein
MFLLPNREHFAPENVRLQSNAMAVDPGWGKSLRLGNMSR